MRVAVVKDRPIPNFPYSPGRECNMIQNTVSLPLGVKSHSNTILQPLMQSGDAMLVDSII